MEQVERLVWAGGEAPVELNASLASTAVGGGFCKVACLIIERMVQGHPMWRTDAAPHFQR